VLAPEPFVLVVLVRGIEDIKQSAALIARIARVLYDEAQASAGAPRP
jgi:phenylpyruvate tautomerase PptA (4-oxalocrotonate tautomerase family)